MARVFTYFIGPENGPVKIGKAKNVHSRLRALQTSSPNRLSVHGVIFGSDRVETALHKRFSKYRINGEWFELNQEVSKFIELETIPIESVSMVKVETKNEIDELKAILREKNESKRLQIQAEIYNDIKSRVEHDAFILFTHHLGAARELIGLISELEKYFKETDGASIFLKQKRDVVRSLLKSALRCDWRTAEWFLYDERARGKTETKQLGQLAKEWVSGLGLFVIK